MYVLCGSGSQKRSARSLGCDLSNAIGILTGAVMHWYKKENHIFLIYKDIQSGAVAKSFMRKSFLIYVERRKFFLIYEEAVAYMSKQLRHSEFPYIWGKLDFLFYQCGRGLKFLSCRLVGSNPPSPAIKAPSLPLSLSFFSIYLYRGCLHCPDGEGSDPMRRQLRVQNYWSSNNMFPLRFRVSRFGYKK